MKHSKTEQQIQTSADKRRTATFANGRHRPPCRCFHIDSLAGAQWEKLVNDETKERTAALAKSLNYSINIGAQNLRLKQSRTIAVVIPYDTQTRQHLTDPFFLGMLGSLADALTERGFDMLVSRVDAEQLDSVSQI
jgi:DNA-binding LacI/PurR family transcriptional regulator